MTVASRETARLGVWIGQAFLAEMTTQHDLNIDGVAHMPELGQIQSQEEVPRKITEPR